MTRNILLSACLLGALSLTACGPQSTPSMVNTTRPQLAPETMIQQVFIDDLKDGHIDAITERYKRYGTSTLQLSLGYDETSKNYTAMNAFKDLSAVKTKLAQRGIKSVTAETVKIGKGERPVLWVNFDAVTAMAPEGCTTMPGVDHNTTRFMGQYKFGCSIDTMLAKQIYRPADLEGNSYMEPASGRKAATNNENYEVVTESEANEELDAWGRPELQSD